MLFNIFQEVRVLGEKRIAELEQRVAVLESRMNDGFKSLELLLDTKFQHIEDIIDSLTSSVDNLRYEVQELSGRLDVSQVKYNGYSEKFATKLELSEVRSEVEQIKAKDQGVMAFLNKWGTVLAIIWSAVAILVAFGVM